MREDFYSQTHRLAMEDDLRSARTQTHKGVVPMTTRPFVSLETKRRKR